MPLGAISPATAGGYFDLEHYRMTLDGDAEMTRLISIAKAMGIGAPAIGLAGPAQLDLGDRGCLDRLRTTGAVGETSVTRCQRRVQGVHEPLQLASATATLADQAVNVSIVFGRIQRWAHRQRGCQLPPALRISRNLHVTL